MDKRIESYAELLVKVGLNIQKGQTLVASCPVECAPFMRLVADAAYDCGAREVVMVWNDDHMTRQKYLHADSSVFDSFPRWTADMYNSLADEQAARLAIHSEDPEVLTGVDPDRLRRAGFASGTALAPFRRMQSSYYFPWCVASAPCTAWAKKIFPEKSDADAYDALWDAILNASRVFEGGDPIAEWQKHNAALAERVKKLESYDFKSLRYKNSLGTDLYIELPEQHIWRGGAKNAGTGVRFNANIPTEECFTAPVRTGVEGIAFASKPLVTGGSVADGFSFTFEKGKIVDVKAERGQKLLENAISVDEGASYLGEVALVPYDSPISKSGILFYNTLFDENASCHLAFGSSYPCVKGGTEMSREELDRRGLNASMTHQDFMVGTPDLSIIGTTHDGKEVPIFVDGNFAF